MKGREHKVLKEGLNKRYYPPYVKMSMNDVVKEST